MQSGEELPGREGTLVYPRLLSLVYVPQKTANGIGYKMAYIEAPANRALCFKCIENKIPDKKTKKILEPIYNAYQAETNVAKIEQSQYGRMLDCASDEFGLLIEAQAEESKKMEALKYTCIFCDGDVEIGEPYFSAKVIDKVKTRTTLFGSYALSSLKNGKTFFRICFEDFAKRFPRCFEQLSYDMLGEKNPNQIGVSEIYISPQFEEAMKNVMGESVDELINELVKKNVGHLRIIRKPKGK